MRLTLRYAAVSDIGRSRKKNDDSGYAGPHFLMVADGMGGAPAGDLASAVAVQTMRWLDAPAPDNLTEALAGAVHRANDRLAELMEDDASVDGMGTTVSAVLFDGRQIGVAHLGDSRGYLWRDGELLRITRDHSWVQSLIDEGRISEDEAKVHSHRSLLLKVLDGRHDNDPDLTMYDVQAGDRIMLCSDGLSGFVEHDRMQRVLGIGTAESVAEELVQLALEAASTDNITVVVADVVDELDETGELPVVGAAETGEVSAEDAGSGSPAEVTDQAPVRGLTDSGSSTSAVVVGAAADPPRGPLSRLRTWTHRDDADSGKTLLDDETDPEQLRYAPRAPQRLRWLRRAVILAVVLAVAAGAGKIGYDWSQRQYYVASDGDQVAIYRGVQAGLPGLTLHHVYENQPLTLSELPTYRRSQVLEGMEAGDLNDARTIVATLQGFATACAVQAAATTHPSTSSSTATTHPSTSRSTSTAHPTTSIASTVRHHPHHPAITSKPHHRPRSSPRTTAPTKPPTRTGSPKSTTSQNALPSTTSANGPATTAGEKADASPAECAGATVANRDTTAEVGTP
ncbi:MAG: PP2C family protein-serine/threonine phosphatase [Nocardioidaceae bacterium]